MTAPATSASTDRLTVKRIVSLTWLDGQGPEIEVMVRRGVNANIRPARLVRADLIYTWSEGSVSWYPDADLEARVQQPNGEWSRYKTPVLGHNAPGRRALLERLHDTYRPRTRVVISEESSLR